MKKGRGGRSALQHRCELKEKKKIKEQVASPLGETQKEGVSQKAERLVLQQKTVAGSEYREKKKTEDWRKNIT